MTNKLNITLFWVAALFVFILALGGIEPVADAIGAYFGFIDYTETQPFTIYRTAGDNQ